MKIICDPNENTIYKIYNQHFTIQEYSISEDEFYITFGNKADSGRTIDHYSILYADQDPIYGGVLSLTFTSYALQKV